MWMEPLQRMRSSGDLRRTTSASSSGELRRLSSRHRLLSYRMYSTGRTGDGPLTFVDIPDELCSEIFQHLDIKGLIATSSVDKRLKKLTDDVDVWDFILQRDHPDFCKKHEYLDAELLKEMYIKQRTRSAKARQRAHARGLKESLRIEYAERVQSCGGFLHIILQNLSTVFLMTVWIVLMGLRLDGYLGTVAWSVVFIPLYILDILVVMGCTISKHAIKYGVDTDDWDSYVSIVYRETQHRKQKWYLMLITVPFLLLQILTLIKLDGVSALPWSVVAIPVYVSALVSLVATVTGCGEKDSEIWTVSDDPFGIMIRLGLILASASTFVSMLLIAIHADGLFAFSLLWCFLPWFIVDSLPLAVLVLIVFFRCFCSNILETKFSVPRSQFSRFMKEYLAFIVGFILPLSAFEITIFLKAASVLPAVQWSVLFIPFYLCSAVSAIISVMLLCANESRQDAWNDFCSCESV